MKHDKLLIIADIEGSAGCRERAGAEFMTEEWARACVEMSRDIDAVVHALFNAGARTILIKDFHRTGYNLMPELIDPRARIVHGYRRGPIPGIGETGGATGLLMIGMHAPSGSGGFLAHTLTSRISRLEVNGELLSEAELFSASVAPFGAAPLFFSGGPVACTQAQKAIPQLAVYPIDKSVDRAEFDTRAWRNGLARAAVLSLDNPSAVPFLPEGPFSAAVTLRDGPSKAKKLALRWGFPVQGDTILLEREDIHSLYYDLIRLCYLTPCIERLLPAGLALFNAWGRIGLFRTRRMVRGLTE